MVIDLHLHSDASDGADGPSALMDRAAAAGVAVAALTDHDTLSGLDEASEAAERLGITLLPGVELSVDHDDIKMHMVVYFVEPGGPFEDRLAALRSGRDVRNVEIVGRLNELGYPITMDDVLRHARGASVGRPHIADALVERGAFGSRNDVFEHLLHDGGPAYHERDRMTAVEAIDLARRSGAVPVVAHPATISAHDIGYAALFATLVDHGLGGIEAHHPMHPPSLRTHLTELALDLGVAATGGSDYHGVDERTYRIGTGNGDLRVPESAFEALLEQRAR